MRAFEVSTGGSAEKSISGAAMLVPSSAAPLEAVDDRARTEMRCRSSSMRLHRLQRLPAATARTKPGLKAIIEMEKSPRAVSALDDDSLSSNEHGGVGRLRMSLSKSSLLAALSFLH